MDAPSFELFSSLELQLGQAMRLVDLGGVERT